MFGPPTNSYGQSRLRHRTADRLHDGETPPPEWLVQSIWQHQRLRRDRLQTATSEVVRIIHPGFRSVEGGPDFRNALIQIGKTAPRTGDVEIDLRPGGWRAHGHDRNPAFRNVILHVVWEGTATVRNDLPLMALSHVLDAPVGELALWLDQQPGPALPEKFQGKCSGPLRGISEARLMELLGQAAQTRLQAKAAQFRARARQAGWEQALWEGLFRALGYKHNTWPMLQLAESREQWRGKKDSVPALQARLLGMSGLLPTELNGAAADGNKYLRKTWDSWWRERDEFETCLLPRTAWKFHGLRPANHPQRRLALAAHWLVIEKLPARLERWCATPMLDQQLAGKLLEIFKVPRDAFWSWHWTLRSDRLAKPQPLLGEKRLTDLAINVVLPWLWARAREGSSALRNEVERRYFAWPAAEDNAVLRQARSRLLGGNRVKLTTAAVQQGLLQIVCDYCAHSNAVCENCQFPELVSEWTK